MNNVISIIIPIYNGEMWVEMCIDSVREQTYTDIQIILVNDGSEDKSLEICKKYSKKDSRIVVLDKVNGGQSSARNLGLVNATGSYIQFLDCDDTIDKNTCEIAIKAIKEEPMADLVVFGFKIYKYYKSWIK